jgi:hypothetical protein
VPTLAPFDEDDAVAAVDRLDQAPKGWGLFTRAGINVTKDGLLERTRGMVGWFAAVVTAGDSTLNSPATVSPALSHRAVFVTATESEGRKT